jgi:hypothetical protein
LPSGRGNDCPNAARDLNISSTSDSEVAWNERLAPSDFESANGLCWRETCNKKGVRASSPVTTLFSAPAPQTQTGKSDGGFQAVFAIASQEAVSASASIRSGAKTFPEENAASFPTASHEKSQPASVQSVFVRSEAGAHATAPIAPVHDDGNAAKKDAASAPVAGSPANGLIGWGTTARYVASAVSRVSSIPEGVPSATVQNASGQSQVGATASAIAAPIHHEEAARKTAANSSAEKIPTTGLIGWGTTTRFVANTMSRVSSMLGAAQPAPVHNVTGQSQADTHTTPSIVPASPKKAAGENAANTAAEKIPANGLIGWGTTSRFAAGAASLVSSTPVESRPATVQNVPSQSQAGTLATAAAAPVHDEIGAKKNAANALVERVPENGPTVSDTNTRATTNAASSLSIKPEESQPTSGQNLSVQGAGGVRATATVAPTDKQSNSTKDTSHAQEEGQSPSDGASELSATSAGTADAPVSAAAPATQPAIQPGTRDQLLASQLAPDASAAETTAKPARQLAPAAPFVAAVDEAVAAQIAPGGMPDISVSAQAVGENVSVSVSAQVSAALPNFANSGAVGNQPVGKAAMKESSVPAGSRNAGLANTADATPGKTTETASSTRDTSSHGAQNNDQPSQNSQASPAQTAASVQRAADDGAAQVQAQTVVMAAAAHDPAAAHRTPSGLEDAPRAIDPREVPASIQSDGGEAIAASGINGAKLIQAMNESEMRVGMHSNEFGDISIRTSVSQQQMSAQISLDHSELSQAISAHVSAIQTKLGDEYGLHASIEIDNHGSSFSGGSENSSQGDQRSFAGSLRSESSADQAEADAGPSLGTLVAAGNGHRLDIRA